MGGWTGWILRCPQNLGYDSELHTLLLGAYSLVGDITYITYTDIKVRLLQCFEPSVIRSINRAHWNTGEGTDDIVLWGLMGKFVILYLMCLYRDFGESLGNQQLEHLNRVLFHSYVTSQAWKKQSRIHRDTGEPDYDVKIIYLYSSFLTLLLCLCTSLKLFFPFFPPWKLTLSGVCIFLKSRILLTSIPCRLKQNIVWSMEKNEICRFFPLYSYI